MCIRGRFWRARALGAGLASCAFAAFTADRAAAGGLYSATLDTTLTFTGVLDEDDNLLDALPEGLYVFVTGVKYLEVTTEGNGFATARADASIPLFDGDSDEDQDYEEVDLGLGDTVTTSEGAEGGTLGPGDFAESYGAIELSVAAINDTDRELTLAFEQSYTYSIASSVDDPATEYAYSVMGLLVGNLFSGDYEDIFELVEFTDSRTGSGTVEFFVTIRPGDIDGFDAVYDAGGDPRSIGVEAVPEPASLALATVGLAVVGLTVVRRRRG